jgi:preprotein translocase subunit SecF
MEIIEERTIGPSLGAENIERGFNSTLYGFLAIAVFMVIYYLLFGLISVVALSTNLLLLVALLSMLQATLTLPGIAAIALTLGMAIDANVLINERIREELRNGATPQAAITAGYERAFGTILDSNVTSLIAGLALLIFGSGPVRGFAVVHCLGILTSMFSSVVVSRGIVNLDLRQPAQAGQAVDRQRGLEVKGEHHGILQDPQRHPLHAPCAGVQRHLADHLRRRGVLPRHRGLHFSVEFTGGTLIEVSYAQAADTQKIRDALAKAGYTDTQVVNFGSSRDVLIRMPLKPGQDSAALGAAVMGALSRTPPARTEARRVRRPAGRQGAGRERRHRPAAGDLRHHRVPGAALRMALRRLGHHRQPARRGDHPRLLRLLPVGVLAAGAGRRAGRAGLFGERVGGGFRPGARELPKMRKATVPQIIDNAITSTISRTIITHGSTQLMPCCRC